MFKNLMNGVSLSAMMLRDADNENGADPKAALREQLSQGNIQKEGINAEQESDDKQDNGDDDEGEENEDADSEEEGDEEKEDDGEVDPNETDEQKTEREAKEKEKQEKETAKLQRKQDRMQRRIDKAVADKKTAEAEIARLKAQLEANPDQKLTAEEIEAKAQALADKKSAEKEARDLEKQFDAACDKLAKAANKADKDFDSKIQELAEDIGPIPSFMIGILEDLDNGGEVLAHIANDDELAEDIWKMRPTKMTKKLVEIAAQLDNAKKPPKKQISKVPDPITPVRTNQRISNTITEADVKDMDRFVAKRRAQMAERRKAQGFN